MKAFITPTYTFTPGASGAGTIDLSSISGFDIKRLIAVINQAQGVLIYSTGSAALKYTGVSGGVVTLFADTSTHSSSDVLQIVYEGIGQKASASSHAVALSTEQEAILTLIAGKDFSTTAKQDAAKAVLDNILTKLNASLAVTGTFWQATQPVSGTVSVGNFPATQPVSGSVSVSNFPATQAVVQTAQTATFQEITNLTTTAQTFTAPASAKWAKVYADNVNTANIRVKIGGTATTTSGISVEPGRDVDFSAVGNISVIAESGTGLKVNVHFGA